MPVADNLIDFDLTGPGWILGAGNGDPSSHEPDVYIPKQNFRSAALGAWRMKLVPGARKRPEVQPDFDDSSWEQVDVETEFGPLVPNQSAVFRGQFEATPGDLASESVTLHFGRIDDEGWVYVNGNFVGESHDWSAQPSFEARKFLRPGRNVIAVAVHNRDGAGGVNKGVALEFSGKSEPVQWQRHAFNGLAQVIVQAGRPGGIHLTARSDGLAAASANISSVSDAAAREILP